MIDMKDMNNSMFTRIGKLAAVLAELRIVSYHKGEKPEKHLGIIFHTIVNEIREYLREYSTDPDGVDERFDHYIRKFARDMVATIPEKKEVRK